MKISFITDEATQSFDAAIAFAQKYDLQGLELRSVENTPIDRISRETLQVWKKKLDDASLCVPCLSGSFFKCDIPKTAAPVEEFEKLERLCRAADILECSLIRGFTFFAPENGPVPLEYLKPYYDQAADILRFYNKRLLLEADPSVNTSNHAALSRMLNLLNDPVFGAIFDPGNDIYDPLHEIPYPDGYEAIRSHIMHIHIKDAIVSNGNIFCVKPGEGNVGYPALLHRLLEDGYDGWLSLETHYRKAAHLTEEQMRLPQGDAFSAGGLEATAECAAALHQLIRNAQQTKESKLD